VKLDSLDELIRALTSKLVAVASYYLREDAEDAVQEVWEKVVRHADYFEGVENKEAWLVTVTRRHCIDNLRKRKRHEDKTGPLPFGEYVAALTRGGVDPEDACLDAETKEIILRYVRSINEVYGVALKLFYYDGLSANEIAVLLGIGEGAVRQRLYMGRLLVKKIILQEGYFNGEGKRG